jgi:hypothetical protein
MAAERISLSDIDSKLRGIQGDAKSRLDDRKQPLIAGAGGMGLLLLIIMYLIGRRSGKKKTTFVEIRRV